MPMIDIQLIVTNYRTLELDLPEEVTEVLDTWAALNEPIHASPGDDLRVEFVRGRLTTANAAKRIREAALTLSLKDGMQALVRDLDRPAAIRAQVAFGADADRVVTTLAERYSTGAATILEGLGHFSPDEYAHPELLLTQRPGAAAHYHPTMAAAADLNLIASLLNAIRSFNAIRPLNPVVSGYVTLTGEATAETLSAAQSAYNRGTPLRWVAVLATPGVAPKLNTLNEAQQVAAKSAELGRVRDLESKNQAVSRGRRKEKAWVVS